MRHLAALIWKEYREQRWFFVMAAVFFLGLPLLNATLEYYNHQGRDPFYPDNGDTMALLFGGLLAVFLATGATCRDLRENLQAFWRSRPIRPMQLLLAKCALGLAILLVVTCGPLVVQLATRPADRGSWHLDTSAGTLLFHSFTLMLIYSVAFLLGCLVRRAGRAAVLSFAAGLSVYSLPVVLPPLKWLDVLHLIQKYELRGVSASAWLAGNLLETCSFMIAMLVGSIASLLLACLAVRRNWSWRLNKRIAIWALAGLALMVWVGAAVQPGIVMKCQRQINLPAGPSGKALRARRILAHDDQGVVLLTDAEGGADGNYFLARLDLSRQTSPLGSPVQIVTRPGDDHFAWAQDSSLTWSKKHLDRVYIVRTGTSRASGHREPTELTLCTIALEADSRSPVIHRIDLLPYFRSYSGSGRGLKSYLYANLVLLHGQGVLITVDLSNPDAPAVTHTTNMSEMSLDLQPDPASPTDTFFLKLLDLPGLSPRQRLEATVQLLWPGGKPRRLFDLGDDLFVSYSERQLVTYRLIEVAQDTARFHREGCRIPSALEGLYFMWPTDVRVENGLVFAFGGGLKTGLTVYDVRNPARPRRFSYYTAAGLENFALASTDRVILGGQDLHVVDVPPRN
ncbi:MAG: hypothetical protein ACYSWU_19905 [Planctomycetota bacterium]